MIMNITRRTMLKGIGATLALPVLEAMLPASAGARFPVRMAHLYIPNGVHADLWTPRATGRNFELRRRSRRSRK